MKKIFTLSLAALLYLSTSVSANDLSGCWTLKAIDIVEYNQVTGAIITNISLSQQEVDSPFSQELSDIIISSFCVSDEDFIVTAKNGSTYLGDYELKDSNIVIDAKSMDGNDSYKETFFLSRNEEGDVSLEKEYTNRTNNTKAKIKLTLGLNK